MVTVGVNICINWRRSHTNKFHLRHYKSFIWIITRDDQLLAVPYSYHAVTRRTGRSYHSPAARHFTETHL